MEEKIFGYVVKCPTCGAYTWMPPAVFDKLTQFADTNDDEWRVYTCHKCGIPRAQKYHRFEKITESCTLTLGDL